MEYKDYQNWSPR